MTELETLKDENERLRADLDRAYLYIGKQEFAKLGIASPAPMGEQKTLQDRVQQSKDDEIKRLWRENRRLEDELSIEGWKNDRNQGGL